MKKFDDPVTPEPNYWPSIRLSDLVDVACKFRRSGMWHVSADPVSLSVMFYDPLISGTVRLSIEPWGDSKPGWYWYVDADLLNGGMAWGSLCLKGSVLHSPWPGAVRRAYFRFMDYERRSFGRKSRGR